jgi:RNA polymerase sigma-70 factor (TIGR02957 family)
MTQRGDLEELRRSGLAIAYRMLGAISEAEDIVQEAMLRYHQATARQEKISSPRSYLATIVTRLAIDELRSARARREAYTGEWLPEPLIVDPNEDPASRAEMADSLSMAFLVLLENLSPEQRAAFLLHDVFDYDYERIAGIIEVTEHNARQLASRARRHIGARRPRFEPSRSQREELAQRFFAAAREGDMEGLHLLLAEGVTLYGDGGGNVPALARPLVGRARVARTLTAWVRAGMRDNGFTMQYVQVNGQPGAIIRDREGKVLGVLALDIANDQVQDVRSIVNPRKLAHLGPVADLAAFLQGD